MPGQTRRRRRGSGRPVRSFNGGPDNCPAKHTRRRIRACPLSAFNGGPDNCPAKPPKLPKLPKPKKPLQWRAGQLPGQTSLMSSVPLATVRYLQWRAGQLPGQTGIRRRSSRGRRGPFNGGPDNCPAKLAFGVAVVAAGADPSMEGRTIARPNHPLDEAIEIYHDPSMEGRTIARPNPRAS